MDQIKRLFIGSIILILTITPILANAEIIENTNPFSLNISDENSLGTLNITHYPKCKMDVDYDPPADYNYYFPEDENEYVYLNFTLQANHRKSSGLYWMPHRWTGITLWITYDGIDLIYLRLFKECNSFTYEHFNMAFFGPLFTNDSVRNLTFYCIAFPVPSFTQQPLQKWIDFCEITFGDLVAGEEIFIYPI